MAPSQCASPWERAFRIREGKARSWHYSCSLAARFRLRRIDRMGMEKFQRVMELVLGHVFRQGFATLRMFALGEVCEPLCLGLAQRRNFAALRVLRVARLAGLLEIESPFRFVALLSAKDACDRGDRHGSKDQRAQDKEDFHWAL